MSDFNNLDESSKKALIEIANEENIRDYEIIIDGTNPKGNNYLGEIICVEISGKNDKNEIISKNLIMKISPKHAGMRELIPITKLYDNEVFSYNFMLPALQELQSQFDLPVNERYPFIKCYKSSTKELEEFLIMENLASKGFKMCSRKKSLDFEHVKLAIENIARFHSFSFALKKHNPQLYEEISKYVEKNMSLYSENIENFLNMSMKLSLQNIQDPHYKKVTEDYAKGVYPKIKQIITASTHHPYNVFCHGDFWQNNILFKYEDNTPVELRFVDWQMIKHCSPIVDISHFLYSATDETLRNEHLESFLDMYYETLSSNLTKLDCQVSECYPRDVYKNQLKQVSQYGFVYTTISLGFLMREDDDVLDVETLLDNVEDPTQIEMKFQNQKSVNDFVDRLEGVIKDFLRLDLL